MSSRLQHPHRFLPNRFGPALIVVLVLLGVLVLPVAGAGRADADPAPAATPTIVGEACAPATGVTVVVDFRELNDRIELGCAVGPQSNGVAALTNAGFGVNVGVTPYPGTVCTLDGVPTQGYPYCWTTGGLWSYWTSNGSAAWAFSPNGAASTGAVPVGSVQGWSWNQGFATQATPPRVTVADLAAHAGTSAPEAAVRWLKTKLAANGWQLDGQVAGTTDWGVTIDAVLALAASGRSDTPAAAAATAAIEAHVTDYVTWGPDYPSSMRVANSLAKVLLVAAVQGADVHSFGGWDLEAELRDLMVTDGAGSGKFVDDTPGFPDADTSHGFGQALAILALARTDGGVPAEATRFLLAQQCPGGGFRVVSAASPTCTAPADSDADTTAMAVQALLVVERTPAVKAALGLATRWMLDLQVPADGSFRGTGLLSEPNANGTGLMAQALRQVGLTAQAADAAGWIASLQLTPANATGTPAAADLGAIGRFPGDLTGTYPGDPNAALIHGITSYRMDQWRRATAQGVLGLGLPAFGSINDSSPVVPVVPVDLGRFSDVGPEHTFFGDIMWLTAGGITTGNVDGTFAPSGAVSRQANAAFLYRLAGSPDFVAPVVPSFSDVAVSSVFFKEIEWMKHEGLTTGNPDGTFAPLNAVSRQAFAAFLYRLAGSPEVPAGAPVFVDVGPEHTFFDAISWLASTGVTTGYDDGTFRPTVPVSRQATAAFLHRFSLLP